MNESRWNEIKVRVRQKQKDKRRCARIKKSKLYWIFDPRLHETHEISMRDTEQAFRRMKIRYFFSWEGLSKFLLAPVFKIGLTSIIVTPFLASVYISFREVFSPFFDYKFPMQMGLLFLSGLSVVIARIIYELSCPKLVKAHVNHSSLDTQHLQNKQWIQVELEYCLLNYVISWPMSEDYIKGKQIQAWQKRIRERINEEVADPPRDSSLVPELAFQKLYGSEMVSTHMVYGSLKIYY